MSPEGSGHLACEAHVHQRPCPPKKLYSTQLDLQLFVALISSARKRTPVQNRSSTHLGGALVRQLLRRRRPTCAPVGQAHQTACQHRHRRPLQQQYYFQPINALAYLDDATLHQLRVAHGQLELAPQRELEEVKPGGGVARLHQHLWNSYSRRMIVN